MEEKLRNMYYVTYYVICATPNGLNIRGDSVFELFSSVAVQNGGPNKS